jgi:hypothetical protein
MRSSASAGQHQSSPRDSKQLRHPQASKGDGLAAAASALHFPFHPTSCSWVNAVEGLFTKLTRQRLKRGVFISIVELQPAINRLTAETNDKPKPFVWTNPPASFSLPCAAQASARRAPLFLDHVDHIGRMEPTQFEAGTLVAHTKFPRSSVAQNYIAARVAQTQSGGPVTRRVWVG